MIDGYRTLRALGICAQLFLTACAAGPPGERVAQRMREAEWLARVPYDAWIVARNEAAIPAARPFVELLADPLHAIAASAAIPASVRREIGFEYEEWRRLLDPPAAGASRTTDACGEEDAVEAIGEWLKVVAPIAGKIGVVQDVGSLDAALAFVDGLSQASDYPQVYAVSIAEPLRGSAAVFAASARLLREAREWRACIWPTAHTRSTPFGKIRFGSGSDDVHDLSDDIVFIFDPGGDDVYRLVPVRPGAVMGLLDLGGDDRYTGRAVSVAGVSAVFDLGGDDRYEFDAGGAASTIGGIAVQFDSGGRNIHLARRFSQSASLGGVAALIAGSGDDFYSLTEFGQAAATADGYAVIIEYGGDDVYEARGAADPFARGGDISLAQGVATGARGASAGGVALLEDFSGNDVYSASQFAQGVGYALGLGMLVDHTGQDRYSAVRYAQGAGIHGGAGLLLDLSGDDVYFAAGTVAQGASVDVGIGILIDGGGDDRFRAAQLAQAGTEGGGLAALSAVGSHCRFEVELESEGNSWGGFRTASGFPGFAAFVPCAHPTFSIATRPVAPVRPPPSATLAETLARAGRLPELECPAGAEDAPAVATADWRTALRLAAPLAGDGAAARANYAAIGRLVATDPALLVALMPKYDTNAAVSVREALRCLRRSTRAADFGDGLRALFGKVVDGSLANAPVLASAFADPHVAATATDAEIGRLMSADACALRVLAMQLDRLRGPSDEARVRLDAARRDPCLRLQFVAHRMSGADAARFRPVLGSGIPDVVMPVR